MAQSKAELTTDKQIFYLVQWFAEFSDFQRTDFLQDHLLPLYQEFLKSKFFGPDASGDNETDEKKVANGVSSIGKCYDCLDVCLIIFFIFRFGQ